MGWCSPVSYKPFHTRTTFPGVLGAWHCCVCWGWTGILCKLRTGCWVRMYPLGISNSCGCLQDEEQVCWRRESPGLKVCWSQRCLEPLLRLEGTVALCWTQVRSGQLILCVQVVFVQSHAGDVCLWFRNSEVLQPGIVGVLRSWLCGFMYFIAVPVLSQDAFAEP